MLDIPATFCGIYSREFKSSTGISFTVLRINVIGILKFIAAPVPAVCIVADVGIKVMSEKVPTRTSRGDYS